jgi:hypothetical protein
MRARLPKLSVLALIALAVTASSALAFWAAGGSGNGTGSTASLSKPAVTVPATSSGDITVSWTASVLSPSNAAGNSLVDYTVERSANAGTDWTAACGGATISALTCNDSVSGSGNYIYRVTAHLNSWSALSDNSSSVARRPARPVVSAATGAATIATVTGTAEAGSNVKLYTDNTCTTAALDSLGNSGASGTATGGNFSIQATVPAGQTRTFYATASANSLVSDCSTTSASYSAPNVVVTPSAPNSLTATAQAPTGATASFGNIDLSWTAVANATSYQVFRSTSANAATSGALVGTVLQPGGGAGSSASFTDSPPSLTFGTYFYAVKALNGAAASAASSDAGPATTRVRPPTLNTVAEVGSSNQMRLTWTAPTLVPPGVTLRYNTYRSTSSAGPFSAVAVCSNFAASPCTDSTTTSSPNTTWHYRVTAFAQGSPASESVVSNTVSGSN